MTEKAGRGVTKADIAQRILVGSALAGVLVGGGGAAMRLNGIAPSAGVVGAFVAVLAIVGALAMIIYWRHLDEAAREAHKFAWFWGGFGGGAVALVVANFLTVERLEAMFGVEKPTTWLVFGMFAMLAAQVAGYVVAWAGWWLARWK